ncbi:MAG TPA: sulfite exporter TauE/SafE family protein [Usitatibacteraceae bacterium]|nr:sulfite exporter TauE/SafE family protein [Usitatibacteraceae bacterium]
MPGEALTWLTYAGLGVVVGFFSGLLGIGGGSMIVPILGLVFVAFGFPPDQVMHLSLGTSLAAILAATASGARAHQAHGAVRGDIVKGLAPGIAAAGLAAGAIARVVSVAFLKYFFLAFMFYVTTQILFGLKPARARPVPGRLGLFGVGALIGGLSGLAGVGGAMISVPFMTAWGVPFKSAIGTSAAISFVVAVAGTIGYVAAGLTVPSLPAWTVGYVYLPALLGISVTSVFVAPWGARVAHRLPVGHLKKAFAVFLLALAVKLITAL